jgi:acyl-coenzyme A thioesterase 9
MEKRFPFGSQPQLREQYVNYLGDLRFGKMMEEMDAAAGAVSYRHADGFELDLTIVTAACDRIDLLGPLPSTQDLRMAGQVNGVGRSSMEIGLTLETYSEKGWCLVAEAYFIMVARKGEHPAAIHKLNVTGNAEAEARWQAAEKRKALRKDLDQRHYREKAPSAEESVHLHKVFGELKKKSFSGRLMQDTVMTSTVLMHPQDRNIHHKIFGGHLMRLSFESAWGIAHLFTGRRPLFLAVDHFDFIKPVEIGSLVKFSGQVVYTGKTSYIIEVVTEVINPRLGEAEITNVSHFTFVAMKDNEVMEVPQIFPVTYAEGLKYLDGRRRYLQAKENLKALRSKA